MRTPWMKFYPADWQADLQLRSCSIAARGLWMELICIMQKAEPAGFLLVSGKIPSNQLLSVLCGLPEKDVAKLMAELERARVFSRSDYGVIYSRRMLRDIEKREKDRLNGSLGGNPSLKAGVNPPDNGGDKAHMPEARVQKKPTKIEANERGSFDKVESREVGALRPLTVVGGGA